MRSRNRTVQYLTSSTWYPIELVAFGADPEPNQPKLNGLRSGSFLQAMFVEASAKRDETRTLLPNQKNKPPICARL